jgi:hypothetical protein
MTEKIGVDGRSTERQELEARIERLRQVADSMEDREAAAQLMMLVLALEVKLLNKEQAASVDGLFHSSGGTSAFRMPIFSRMRAKCTTAPSFTGGGCSASRGCRIFGRFRPVRIVRKRGAIPHQSAGRANKQANLPLPSPFGCAWMALGLGVIQDA